MSRHAKGARHAVIEDLDGAEAAPARRAPLRLISVCIAFAALVGYMALSAAVSRPRPPVIAATIEPARLTGLPVMLGPGAPWYYDASCFRIRGLIEAPVVVGGRTIVISRPAPTVPPGIEAIQQALRTVWNACEQRRDEIIGFIP